MDSDSDREDMFYSEEDDVGPDTHNLLGELRASETGSPTIIPPTPKRKKDMCNVSNSAVFRRLAFSSAAPATVVTINEAKVATSRSADCTPTPSIRGAHGDILKILSEVTKTNTKLTEYGQRLETLEHRMSSIEQTTHEPPTCSSSCSDARTLQHFGYVFCCCTSGLYDGEICN